MSAQTIAVLGLGQMGAGMALCLAEAGHAVQGYDVDAGARNRLDGTGVAVHDASALSDAAAGVSDAGDAMENGMEFI